MNPHTAGQLRAFASACFNKQLNKEEEQNKAEAIARKPFSDFSFEEMNTAIQRLNSFTAPMKLESKEERQARELAEYLEQRRIQNEAEDYARERALMREYTEAFGDDFEEVLAPLIYSIRRPAQRAWWEPWNALFQLPTLEERRDGLNKLLAQILSSTDLTNLEIEVSSRQLMQDILSSIGTQVT